MPVACSLKSTAREFKSLRANPFVNRLLGGPLHSLALQHVTRRLPAGMVREVSEPGNVAYGWLDKGGVVINTARPVRADTPLHELTHLWLLMLRAGKTGDLGRRYEQLSQQMSRDPAFMELARNYPLTADYRFSDQVEEVSALLVGQLAARRMQFRQVPVVGRLLELAEKVLGRYLGLQGQVLSRPLHELVSALADDMLAEAPVDVDATWLAEHVLFARYQGADQPANAHDFISRISGVGAGISPKRLRNRAQVGLNQIEQGETTITLPNPLGGADLEIDMSHLTADQRRDEVMEHYRQLEASKTALAGDGALALLALPVEQLSKILAGDYKDLPAHPQYSKESLQALAMQLANAFDDVQPQDTITRYSETSMPPGTYHPEFDNGLTMVHLKPRRLADGKTITEVSLVRLMSNANGSRAADLTAKREDRPLLAGLYSGSWGKAAKGWATKRLFGITMTASGHNRSLLGTAALALHLTDLGYKVTGVGVGKIDMNSAPEVQRNDVRLVPITEYLETWKGLSKVEDVRELLPVRLRELLQKPELLETTLYEHDYLRTLRHYAEGKKDLGQVAIALGEFEAAGRQNSARGLIRSIEVRQGELVRFYGDNRGALYKNREFVLLGEAHRQLQGVMVLANKHADLGAFTQYVRSFNAGDNPVLQWFYEQWRTAREATTDKFLLYQRDRIDRTKALMDDYHQAEGGMLNLLYHDEAKYYDALFVKSTQSYQVKKGVDGAGRDIMETRSMEVNEHRFKMPGTQAFEALRPAQRAYIEWALDTMKTAVIEKYVQANSHGKEPTSKQLEKAEKWYARTWGQGFVPVVEGSVSQSMLATAKTGEHDAQLLRAFQNQLDENFSYDQQANTNQDTLSDRFHQQAGETPHGSGTRLEMLGLMASQERDPASGQLRTVYVLDPEAGRLRNLSLEPDFQRVIDQFMMSNFKHLQATDLHTKKLSAVAMIRAGFAQSGALRGTQENNEDNSPAEAHSRVEDNLNKMYQLLVLGNRNQIQQNEAVRRMGYWLAAGGNVASQAALGFSLATAVSSQVSNIFNALDVGLANWGQKQGLTIPAMTKALAQFKSPGKLWAMCRLMRTLDMDEHALLEGYGAVGRRASDVLKESFILDRMGDMAVRMWLTAAQMIQDKSWDAYDWDEKKGTLSYNEARHREIKGDAYVNAVRRRQLDTGELGLDDQGQPQAMTRSHDDRLRGSVEAWNTEVFGGYKEEVDTTLATNIFLRMIRKFRVFMVKRIDDWTKDERHNTNQGYYDEESGQWVSRQEIGLFTSLGKLFSGVGLYRGNVMKTWQEMSEADRYNLRRASAGALSTVAAMLLAEAVFGDDDDDEQTKKKKKEMTVAQRVLNSLMTDQFLAFQMQSVTQAITSPMVVVSFLSRMSAAVGNYLSGDVDSGNRIFARNVGILKTANWADHVLFGADDKK